MKTLLMVLSLACSTVASAQQISIQDPEIGSFKVEIENLGESANPLRMRVKVLCKDRRIQRNLVQPVWEEVQAPAQICILRDHEYNPATKEIVVRYGISRFAPGPARCNTGMAQPFDLAALCSAWR